MVCLGGPALGHIDHQPPEGFECLAPHGVTGAPVKAIIREGRARPFWAYAGDNAARWPEIVFDNGSLGRFPEPVARFTFHHECVHLTAPDLDEVQTSCRALQHMRSSDLINHEDEAVLLRVFQDLGEIPARYLGTGARYWKAIEDCAAAITHDGPPSSANHPPPSAHLERPRDD